jgi:hypothetical protein
LRIARQACCLRREAWIRGGIRVKRDEDGWKEGARLTLVAVVSAVVAATVVIQVGSAALGDRRAAAEPAVILASH